MAIDVFDLAYNLSPEDYAKIIISSGDYFPGFYRFTMPSRTYEPNQLTVGGLIKLYLNQITTGRRRSRTEWFRKAMERLAALDDRLKSRSDYAVYRLLDKQYKHWITEANEYDVAIIETSHKKLLEKDQTYFFMGAMVRFTDREILLGYDDFRDVAVERIPVVFEKAEQIVNEIYPSNFVDLFIPARQIGTITFDEKQDGVLDVCESYLQYLFTVDANSAVIASNRTKSQKLSMRWAKDIILTEYDEAG